jgi:hypothetical protein
MINDIVIEQYCSIMLADNHYTVLESRWTKLRVWCKYTKKRTREFTKAEAAWNRSHSRYRSKVETAIGHVQNRFGALQKCWQKSRQSLFEVVQIACGIHNYMLRDALE